MAKKNIDMNTLWKNFLAGDNITFASIYYSVSTSLLAYGKKFANDPEADMLLTRNYRKSYVFPEYL